MRQLFAFVAFLILSGNIQAQHVHTKLPSWGFSITSADFQTAADLRSNGLSDVLKEKQYVKKARLNTGLSLTYQQGLSDNVDIAAIFTATPLSYPIPNRPLTTRKFTLMDVVMTGNFKLLSDKYYFVPYLSAGIGVSDYAGYFSAMMPLGAGFQIKTTPNVFIVAGSQYRVPVTAHASYMLNHYLGVIAPLVEPQTEPVIELPEPPVVVITDKDNDGIVDSLDACPDIAGLQTLKGCPDQDGDGVADQDDKCPAEPGWVKYAGCPIPDSDADGINDEKDKCPNEKGYARYEGCPVPDKDGDGVNDENDKCPDVAGVKSNDGCPEIETIKIIEEAGTETKFTANNVQFVLGSSQLTRQANAELDKLVKLLNQLPQISLNIDGYTDDLGSKEFNQALSQKRADAVKAYLVKSGIAATRLYAVGHGKEKPLVQNDSKEGRGKNRRVEFKVRQ